MKVLQVNCVYGNGSTGKIVQDIHRELENRGIESVVCYGRGSLVKEKNIYKTCGEFYSDINHLWANLSGVLYGGCHFSTNKLIAIIKKERPDIVHLHCINGYFVNIYRIVKWLKCNHIKTIVTLHAEFMYTGGCGHSVDCEQWSSSEGCGHVRCPRYRSDMHSWLFDRSKSMWKRMKKAFDGFNSNLIVTSVSPWLKERAGRSQILSGKQHCVVLNGTDTEVFHRATIDECIALKKELNISNQKVIIHVSPYFTDDPKHIKGGYYVIELAKNNPEVQFIVVGAHKEGISLCANVHLIGKVSDQKKLAQFYSMADVTLLTSQRETFSMVTVESLCCGTPVVGFLSGAPEMIALKEYSRFVEYGNDEALHVAINEFLSQSIDKSDLTAKAQAEYSRKKMCEHYVAVYQDII